nr:hypothetical protein [Tanacetum cinerariifolium]
EANNTKPPLSADTFGNNEGDDSVTPTEEVVDSGIGIGNVHGLMDNGGIHNFVQSNAGELMRLQDMVTGERNVTPWVADVRRKKRMLCYVQGSGRQKRKESVGCGSRRRDFTLFGASVFALFNPGPGSFDCRRIWDLGIKIFYRQHLEDKVVSKERGVLRPGLG